MPHPSEPLAAYVRRTETIRRWHSRPSAVAKRAERYREASEWRELQAARWPLSADEVARRAEADARPVDLSWQAGAMDGECPMCLELGRACIGHLGGWASAELARVSACEVCGGSGRLLGETDGRAMAWRACSACNAAPAYPGLRPGGLAERAMALAPRQRETAGELARAKAFWAPA